MTEQTAIFAALAKAQSEMGRALKSAANPHFKSKYADLSEVMDACLPALNANGIAVFQPMRENEGGRYVVTILAHASGETIECPVPLIVQKADMQGLGSAITYARRYGLMSMAGIAPEDDDGNAAAKAAPRQQDQSHPPRDAAPDPAPITEAQFVELRGMIEAAGVSDEVVCQAEKVAMLAELSADRFAAVKSRLQINIAKKAAQ